MTEKDRERAPNGPSVHIVCKTQARAWVILVLCAAWSLAWLVVVLGGAEGPIEFEAPFYPHLMVVVGLAACGVAIKMLFWGHDCIELAGREIRFLRRGSAFKRYDVSELRELLDGPAVTRMVFADGKTYRLNRFWKRGKELASFLRMMMDASRAPRGADAVAEPEALPAADWAPGAGVVPGTRKVILPGEYLSFEDECIRCGRPATSQVFLRRVGVIGYFTGHQDPFTKGGDAVVPVCSSCRTKHRVARGVTFFCLMVAAVLPIVAFAETENTLILFVPRGACIVVMLSMAAVAVFGGGGYWRGFADYDALGVVVWKVSGRTGDVTLKFKDAKIASVVARRTSEARREVIAEAKKLLERSSPHE